MKKLVAALLVTLLLLVSPAFADHLQSKTEQLVKWAGCTAQVVTSDAHSVLESFYSSQEHRIYIGTAPGEPRDVWLMVALHEVGHCLQSQEGQLNEEAYAANPVIFELDADRRSAELACGMGLNGPRLEHDLLVWAHEVFGYDGDMFHGSLTERIQAGQMACKGRLKNAEAPFINLFSEVGVAAPGVAEKIGR